MNTPPIWEELCGFLADEMIAAHPDLIPVEKRGSLVRYLIWKCHAYVLDMDNQRRVDTANKLIRKRDDHEPWTAAEQEEAVRFGVRH